jgi:hypothetical protein
LWACCARPKFICISLRRVLEPLRKVRRRRALNRLNPRDPCAKTPQPEAGHNFSMLVGAVATTRLSVPRGDPRKPFPRQTRTGPLTICSRSVIYPPQTHCE